MLEQTKTAEEYPFRLQTLIGNPEAHRQNKRFVDTDLNRQLTQQALQTSASLDSAQLSVEQARALELDHLLGPKFGDASTSSSTKTDLIIDLHTTTANMGTVIIVGQGDVLTTQAAAYVMHKCRNNIDGVTRHSDGSDKKGFDVSILMHTHKNQAQRMHVASIARHSFTIEVGPVPQGVLRHDKVEEMQRALNCALEFFKRYQEEEESTASDNQSSSSSLQQELNEYYPTGMVPCYRSAPALKDGELSAKIIWPSDPENDNFPAWLVHKSIQDRDFHEVQTGDPLFVDLDGTVIPYDGSFGSPIRLTFINEGGYYYASSGTGIAVTRPDAFDLANGKFVDAPSKDQSHCPVE